jgi:hypothetical protein
MKMLAQRLEYTHAVIQRDWIAKKIRNTQWPVTRLAKDTL